MTDISPYGNSESYARGINNRGQVVGEFLTQDGTAYHCFLYSGRGITDLGTLGGPDCVANAINERGEVVGASLVQVETEIYCDPETGTCYEYPVYSWHGFLYKNGRMEDLNTLIRSESGWELNWASDINNRGQIVGYGTVNVSGTDLVFRAFLLDSFKAGKNTRFHLDHSKMRR
jgi:probable HAF family extracellular repeat protein